MQSARGFGRYRLIAKLGQGGMAEVFLAAHRGPLGFEKLVVIKRLKPGIATEPEVNAMFLDEARLAARLNHPNVVQTYECGQIDDQYYIVMEYLEGHSLDRICRKLDPSRHRAVYLAILSDALAGLHYAHDLMDFNGQPLHVVHRDISPHNIFVTYDGQAKVVDFGIAKWATRDADTSTGVVKGKIRYMAPEQALATMVDRRADVFSMGLIFWELVVGERFWGDLSDVQILQRLTFGEIPQLRERWPAAPEALDRICSRALAMRPEDRYATAAQMREDVEAYLATMGRRPSSAEIGRLIGETFANRRAEVRSAISDQLGRLHADTADSPEEFEILPVLEERGGAAPWSQRMPMSQMASQMSQMSQMSQHFAQPVPDHTLGDDGAREDSISNRQTIPTIMVANTQSTRRKALWTAGIAVLSVLLIAGAAWAVITMKWTPPPGPQDEIPAVEPTSPGPGPGPGPTPAPIANLIELRIIATPLDAKIYLDDVELPSNPFFARFSRDGTGHRIRVTADGYTPEARFVVFTRDEVLTINLRPVAQAPTPKGGGTSPRK
ncbi:protein kinase domain-containing protein [Sorangium sp. So ce1335]|uniref:serine/threonine protein kinase n=1 Tax=Sorangium sp. So ce1335 TaxID=3133335 RepID=UPI003F5EEE4D